MFIFTSCEKTEDNTNDDCTSNCTTLRGRFVTLNNAPVPNIKVSLNYEISGLGFGGGYTRKIISTESDQNGSFYKNFFINDKELGNTTNGSFQFNIDDSNLDVNKYIRTNNFTDMRTEIGFSIYSITTRDTIIDKTYYIPKKAYIKVNLNNFIPIEADDFFEVRTFYPFGTKIGKNDFLNSEYSTGFSGYDNWTATKLNNRLNVFVAEGENNVIRILKRKNGVYSFEDFPMIITANNPIELTYNY